MSFEKLLGLVGDNEEAKTVIAELQSTQNDLTGRVNLLEKDSKKAFTKRDEAIGELKTARDILGISEFTEDTLKSLKKGDESVELTNLKKLLVDSEQSKNDTLGEFNRFRSDTALTSAITSAGVLAESANAKTFTIITDLLKDGATVTDTGEVVYKGKDGETLYDQDGGKPMTIASRLSGIQSDEAYAGLFKPRGQGGSGGKPGQGGGQTPHTDLSKLSIGEKGKLMKELGSEDYQKLVQRQKQG